MDARAFTKIVQSQFDAGLAMLSTCIEQCPEERWNESVAKWPFWLVAYHVLCFVDLYAAKSNRAWRPNPRFHPEGKKELEAEYPSRVFNKEELLEYVRVCREKVAESMARETKASLAGPSGFSWIKTPRGEAHLYNLRHLSHHVGQLTGFLRRPETRAGASGGRDVRWVKDGRGWPVAT